LENLKLVEEDTPKPRPGELLVRIRASSLNFHDDLVVLGKIPCTDGRIPMSDGAGEVIAVGDDVDEFKAADTVVSTYWPYWLGGEMTPATKRDIPGDSVDGYAREYVCMPAHAFTKAPAGYTHVEAATLTCAGVTAWRGLVVCGQVKPGDTVLILGTGIRDGASPCRRAACRAAAGGRVAPRRVGRIDQGSASSHLCRSQSAPEIVADRSFSNSSRFSTLSIPAKNDLLSSATEAMFRMILRFLS